MSRLNLRPGAPVKKLTIQHGQIFSGEAADQFGNAEPFKFLEAHPPTE
jgi:choloylglycine hydrolase